MVITSFFQQDGIPTTGLLPTINVWEVRGSTKTSVVTGDTMVDSGDGFYQYDFTTHDPKQGYLVMVDGGWSLYDSRFQTSEISPCIISPDAIAAAVWDAQATNHVIAGSFGRIISDLRTIASNLMISMVDLTDICEMALKYQANRTLIDKRACTLTVFEADDITPLKVFQLKDAYGSPSVTDIVERKPL